MNKLDRYIAAHIFTLTAIVALGLVSIYTFVSFVGDIDETGQGAFGILQLFIYNILRMPAAVYTLMPIIAMLGTLMGLGALAGQGEITAMRAAGVSMVRIGVSTLFSGVLLGVLCLITGDWLAPWGIQAAENYRTEQRYGIQDSAVGQPVWLREGEHFFHIERLLSEDHIAGVEIYTLGADRKLVSAMRVDEGNYVNGQWQFKGVHTTELGEDSAKASEKPSMVWTGSLSPDLLHLFVLEADTLSAPGLSRLIAYLKKNGLDAAEYQLQLWRKLIAPLTVMAMMLFAVPFVLGPLRNTGAGQRLLVGVLLGVGFFVINEVSASLGQLYAWSPILAAGLPTAALTSFGLYRLSVAR